MSWSNSTSVSSVRGALWGFLTFTGVAWLAVSWSVLRLEPTDVLRVAGPVILLGAVSEALRALARTRTWAVHGGLAVLFAMTGGLLMAVDEDSSMATPSALIGWYLMVRGAADVVMSTMARATDRTWGLLMVLGVVQTSLGFYAASAYARSAGLVALILAALALVRGVADLVMALDLRDVPAAGTPREKAAGVAGYAAGLADFAAAATARSGRPRHRAPGVLAGRSAAAAADATPMQASPAELAASELAASELAASELAASELAASELAASELAASELAASELARAEMSGLAMTGLAMTASRAGADLSSAADPATGADDRDRAGADLDAMLALAGVAGAAVASGLPQPGHARGDAEAVREPAMAGTGGAHIGGSMAPSRMSFAATECGTPAPAAVLGGLKNAPSGGGSGDAPSGDAPSGGRSGDASSAETSPGGRSGERSPGGRADAAADQRADHDGEAASSPDSADTTTTRTKLFGRKSGSRQRSV